MKKILCFLLASIIMFSLAACGGGGTESTPTPEATPAAEESAATETAPSETEAVTEEGFELALITDIGTIDDKSFNQGSWEGVKQYAEEFNITHKYYKPAEKSTDSYLSAIELAVKGGAKVIVTPGYLFEEAVFLAQDSYPDTNFILLDGSPHSADYSEYHTAENTVGVTYAEDEAGFLAGYAAVKDGMTKLGFMGGMAVPAVVRYGYGFIQGADYAAKEMGLGDTAITMNYHYTGGFDATPEAQTLAASWYQSGLEVIFGCGGAVGNSVMAAAEQANAKVIGVDVDQSGESETVITSSMKGLRESVYFLLEQYYAGAFPGGQDIVLNAANDGVGLPMSTSKFDTFTQDDYDAIYAELVAASIPLVKDTDESGNPVAVADIPASSVSTTVVK